MAELEAIDGPDAILWRLVAIDLDGTLLGWDHRISPGNIDAVAYARNAGALVLLASGRQHRNVADFARLIGLPPSTPLISYNGALVRTIDGNTLRHTPLPPAPAAEIVRLCEDRDVHLNYYLDDEVYVREETPWVDYYRERTHANIHIAGALTCFDGDRPTKLLLIDHPDAIDRLFNELAAAFGHVLYVTKTEDTYLEFMAPGVNKGVALRAVADYCGVTLGQCVAFGDSYNDMGMVACAGLGIAMENGRDELKALADRIAPPCDQDGVGQVLKELFSGKRPVNSSSTIG